MIKLICQLWSSVIHFCKVKLLTKELKMKELFCDPKWLYQMAIDLSAITGCWSIYWNMQSVHTTCNKPAFLLKAHSHQVTPLRWREKMVLQPTLPVRPRSKVPSVNGEGVVRCEQTSNEAILSYTRWRGY